MDGFAVSLLSQLEPMNPSPVGLSLQIPTTGLGLQPEAASPSFSLTPSPAPQRTASPHNRFQSLWLPWSVDLAGEHAPLLTSVCLLSEGAGNRSA